MRDSTVIIVALVLAVIIIAPSVFAVGSDMMEGLKDFVKTGWQDVENQFSGDSGQDGGQNGGTSDTSQSSGSAGIGATVFFKDGTTTTLEPESSPWWWPLTIYFEGKEVDKIQFTCQLLVDWEGELTSFKVSGPMKVTGEGVTIRSENTLKTYAIDTSWGVPPKNEWFTHWSFYVYDIDFETSLPDGSHTIEASAELQCEAIFASSWKDSASLTGDQAPTTTLTIDIQGGMLTLVQGQISTQGF